MQISPFLTDIAKSYNPKIEYVAFCDLAGRYIGLAQGRGSFEAYRVLIDRNRLPCLYRQLHIFFHEVGHVVLDHVGTKSSHPNELEADIWAFHRMGIIDAGGRVKEENRACYTCILEQSKACLKALFRK